MTASTCPSVPPTLYPCEEIKVVQRVSIKFCRTKTLCISLLLGRDSINKR